MAPVPVRIPSPESKPSAASHHFHAKRRSLCGPAEGGERCAIIGGQRRGTHARWRRGSQSMPSSPPHVGANTDELVGGCYGQQSSRSNSSPGAAPTEGWIQGAAPAQSHSDAIQVEGDGGRVQVRLASSSSVVVPTDLSSNSYLVTMVEKKRKSGESSLKNADDLGTIGLLANWASTNHQSQRNVFHGLEEAPELPRRAHIEAHGKAQLVSLSLTLGQHEQAGLTLAMKPPTIPPIGHMGNNKETWATKMRKGTRYASSSWTPMLRDLHSWANKKRAMLHDCTKCGRDFLSKDALNRHMQHHYPGQPIGLVAGTSTGVFLSTGIAMAVNATSIEGRSHPITFSVTNNKEVKPQRMAGSVLNNIHRGFRLFGVNIVESPREEPMK
uniref:C2H2-type domain-containing protein n=1 Tax=Oryza brachyantha TaxID=4533 RepID=J3KUQ6_ORYBR